MGSSKSEKPVTKYLAFLRGINVGGNQIVKMPELKKVLEKLGYKNVKTFLASGNVAFETAKEDFAKDKTAVLVSLLEQELKKKFGFEILVILRTHQEIQKIIKADPFKDITVTPET